MNKEEIENKIEEILNKNIVKGTAYTFGTERLKKELSTLIQESNRESVRDAYRKGYFDSGVQPTSSEVIKFEKSYMEYLKSLDKKGKL